MTAMNRLWPHLARLKCAACAAIVLAVPARFWPETEWWADITILAMRYRFYLEFREGGLWKWHKEDWSAK